MFIETLDKIHSQLVQSFSCVEPPEAVANLNSKQRRRVLLHSREMDDFLHNEAMSEQELGTSTTHLLLNDEATELIAYVLLAADAIPLGLKEREEEKMRYSNSPALKVVRLAVASTYQGKGIGKKMIRFALNTADDIAERCGVVFLTLDCYEHRVSFYEHLGCKRNQIQTSQREYDSPISMRANIDKLIKRLSELDNVTPSV